MVRGLLPSLGTKEVSYPNADSVKDDQGEGKEDLRDHVRWRENCRQNKNNQDSIPEVPDQKLMIDEADAGEKKAYDREFKNNSKSQHEFGCKGEVLRNPNGWTDI